MKKVKYLFVLLLLVLGMDIVQAFDNTKKVYDYAQILTTKEEKNLYSKVNKFIKKYDMDMVLVTVRYHKKDTTNDYAKDFYNINNFGINNTHDGIIFVIDLNFNTENIGFQTFGNAKKIYNNIRIDNMEKSTNNKNDYYKKFEEFISKSSEYANDGIENSIIFKQVLMSIPWLKIIAISLLLVILFIIYYIFKNKKIRKNIYKYNHVLEDSLDINIRSDKFITTSTNSIRRG